MPSRKNLQRTLAVQAMELGLAIPQVLAHRLSRLALAGPVPSARDWRELHLMSAEKAAAFFESWNAMWLESFRASVMFAVSSGSLFWLRWPVTTRSSHAAVSHLHRAGLAVLGKGVAPFHRRAVANARRLGHTRLTSRSTGRAGRGRRR